MPIYRHHDQRGDMIIQFQVDFPDRIAPKHVDQLKKILPDDTDIAEESIIPDGAVHIKLVPISEEMLRAQAREDEMRNGGPQAVRCPTQ
jgi:DnaJ-class molecular chaperone